MHILFTHKKKSTCDYATLPLGMKQWYAMDDSHLTSLVDSSGNSYHGTVNGITKLQTAPSDCGNCHYFDGSAFGTFPLNNISRSKSIGVWIYIPSGTALGDHYLIHSNDPSAAYYGPMLQVKVKADDFDIIHGLTYGNGVGSQYFQNYNNAFDTWIRVLITFDFDLLTMSHYVNGENVTGETQLDISFWDAKTEMSSCHLGHYKYGSNFYYPFIGYADELMIWNRILTDKEAICDFNNGKCWL